MNPIEELMADAESGRPVVLAAMHGILTSDKRPTWPWELQRLASEVAPEVLVLAEHYWAFPFPRINYWKNISLAKSLANRLTLYAEKGCELHLVGHSNGGVIVTRAARILERRGIRVDSLLLIAPAIFSDVERSGIAELECDVTCWFDRDDPMFRSSVDWLQPVHDILMWPYGTAGAHGLTYQGRPADSVTVRNREHMGMGHTGYFASDIKTATFNRILSHALTNNRRYAR